jgi:cytoskeletal protein RodZ
MKKWMYVISVSGMLAIFLVFYLSATKQHEERERQHAADAAIKKAAKDAEKAAIEAKAREDAETRAKARADAEAKKEADKVAAWEAQGQKIQDATNKYNAQADASAKKAAELEVQLSALRTEKEKLNREAFDLAKGVELGKIARRDAELEIQRTTAMVARRAEQSTMTKLPVVTPPSS